MTSPLPSGLLLDQLMYRSSPSQAEFPSSTPRADFYQSVPHKDKSAFIKPTVGSKRIRESAQPPGAFAAPVQSAPAVIAAPLDHRTLAVTSPLSQPPAAYYPKQQPQWEAGVPRGSDPLSDTSSPVSPIDGGFGTDCSDDLDSGAESPSQTIQLAGGGRLRPQGSLYFLPSADGGVAPFLVQSATQMRPAVPGSVFELSTGAEESVRPAASNWTSPYAASGPALTSPTVNPVSARVPTFFPRKLSSETSTTEQKQPDPVPSDPSSSLPSLFDYSDSAELSSLSSASPVPDSDGPVQSQSDGSAESDTDVESPLKRARSSPSAPGTDPTTDPAPQSCAGFKCRVCARALRTEAHLACHMGVHSGERPCECPTCGQGFKTAADLANHARTHSLEKPFECSACSKAFKRRWELTRHMRVHTQDARPFECAECGKFFQTKTTLASHMRIHSDDKPFGCSVCSKTFKRKGELTLHMRTHTGERPFKCPYCHKGFKQKGTLTQHLPTHTDHRPFTCGQCSSRFKHKSSLTRHVRCHKAAEALAAMGLPAQLRAQLQMRLELDVLKSESQPVDSVPADSQVLESDADWLEACLKSTLSSAPLLPLQDPELDPAPACFRCQIPFDSVADLAEHIGESHPVSAPEPAAESAVHTVLAPALVGPAPPLPAASASVPSPLVAPSLRFEAVFGPRTKSTKSAITPKKQPKVPRPAHKPQTQASSPKSSGHFCSACGKHFKHKYSLTRHTAKHHNHAGVWALAACPMCPQSFDSASLLSRHMVSAHGPSRPSLAGPSVSVSPLSGSLAALASAHYSVPPSPAADLARTFLFDGEAANISC